MLDGLGHDGLGCDCQNTIGLSAAPPIIYWNTEPDKSADGRSVEWSAYDWIGWHKKIADKYGVARANEVTQQWWDKLAWYDTRKITWWYNCDFYRYFQKAYGGSSALIPSLTCSINESGSKVIDAAGNIIENVADVAVNVSDSAKNTSGVLKWLVPLLVVGVVGGVGVYAYKHYIKGNEKISYPRPSLSGTKKPKRKKRNAR